MVFHSTWLRIVVVMISFGLFIGPAHAAVPGDALSSRQATRKKLIGFLVAASTVVVAGYLAYSKWLVHAPISPTATNPPKDIPCRVSVVRGTTTVTMLSGVVKEHKDCRLWPGKAEEWDWNKTGMSHKPGIQIVDVQDLVDKADIFVLSCGMDLKLKVQKETVEYLRSKNKQVHFLETKKAVEEYNELVDQGKLVAALIHSTC